MIISTSSKKKITIKLEIPEWAIGRHIRVFAGEELLAIKPVVKGFPKVKYGKLLVKTVRCNMCGECCKRIKCPYLKHEIWNGKEVWVCDTSKLPLKSRPWVCVIGRPSEKPYCCIEFEEAE